MFPIDRTQDSEVIQEGRQLCSFSAQSKSILPDSGKLLCAQYITQNLGDPTERIPIWEELVDRVVNSKMALTLVVMGPRKTLYF